MKYHYSKQTGALRDVTIPRGAPNWGSPDDVRAHLGSARDLAIDPKLSLIFPEKIARRFGVVPLHFDGETVTVAAADPNQIALADRLRGLVGRNVRLVAAPEADLNEALVRIYGGAAPDPFEAAPHPASMTLEALRDPPRREPDEDTIRQHQRLAREARAAKARAHESLMRGRMAPAFPAVPHQDPYESPGGRGMFFFTVEEGQRVLMRSSDGSLSVVRGPKRVFSPGRSIRPMAHHVAYPGEFLIVRFRDGRQEHIPGPAEVWLDPREHAAIEKQEALQLSAKEAVVVYCKVEETGSITRRIEYGPSLFVPTPGEWLHTFSWHGSAGGSQGMEKIANSLVFEKLWLLPDQMYHDVRDVRTADDAVLMIRLMIFFELLDIEKMLETTHDPIGDFVNAATSDTVEFTGRHDFESFKKNTDKLNNLETYKQLAARASQCGYRINKVVYRGYGAAESLQQMHDQAIEARTRLQLERATETQAQELENYKLEAQLSRASKRRGEQTQEVEHQLELDGMRQRSELTQQDALRAFRRRQAELEAQSRLSCQRNDDERVREHLGALRDLGVDLTAYLTQSRADRLIEVRGGQSTHLHLDPEPPTSKK